MGGIGIGGIRFALYRWSIMYCCARRSWRARTFAAAWCAAGTAAFISPLTRATRGAATCAVRSGAGKNTGNDVQRTAA
jgi:hypothetical protein